MTIQRASPCIGLAVAIPLVWAPPVAASPTEEEEPVELPGKPQILTVRPRDEPVRIMSRNADYCRAATVGPVDSASSGSCPFVDRMVGIDLVSRHESETGALEVSASFQRESAGPFSARRLLTRRNAGLNEEFSLGTLQLKGALLDERVRLTSKIAWSSEWSTPLVVNAATDPVHDRITGTAQSHRIDVKLADTRKFRWSLTGETKHASEDYRTGRTSSLLPLFASYGTRHSLRTKMSFSDIDLKAAFSSNATRFHSARTFDLSAYHRGINIRLKRREGQAKPNEFFQRPVRFSDKTSVGVDLDLYALAPRLALSDGGATSLLPKMLSATYSTEDAGTDRAGGPSAMRYESLDLFAQWDTPLGNTVAGLQLREGEGISQPLRRSSNITLYAMHSFDLGNWSLGFDVMSVDDRSSGTVASGNRVTMFGHSASYSVPGGPKFRLRVGQDTASFGSQSTFAINDRSAYVDAQLDLSAPISKALGGRDVSLTLDYRKRLDDSRVELALFDEVTAIETDSFRGEGLIVNIATRF